MNFDMVIDVTNEESPIPMIRTSELLNLAPIGSVIKVVVNIESAVKNIKTLILNNPYELLDVVDDKTGYVLYIKKYGERNC